MIRNVYEHLPIKIKEDINSFWGKIPYQVKFGSQYIKNEAFLKKSQWWEAKKMNEYQLEKLKKLLVHADRHIPYYHKLFLEHKFNPYMMNSCQMIEKLPFMDKNILESNFNDLIAKNIPERKWAIQTTGGTTGKQLRFLLKKGVYGVWEYPFVNSIWSRVGYKRGKSVVGVLRNQVLAEGMLYQYNSKTQEYIFDTYHLTEKNIAEILDKIKELKIEYLHTYPSSVLLLCNYLKETQKEYRSSLKAILATSENIYPGQKEVIESALHCRLFTFYGHSEGGCIAGWCEKENLYHVNIEYGYCELIDEKGNVITEPNCRGEIVCTGFSNYLMPLIRYKTGDYASWNSERICSCGRQYPRLNDVEGRWVQEMLIGRDGNRISMTALNMHSDIFKNVENYQFIQEEIGKCILRIVRGESYTTFDEEKIRKELNKKFTYTIDIIFEYKDKIERTQRGKQRYIIQKLDM